MKAIEVLEMLFEKSENEAKHGSAHTLSANDVGEILLALSELRLLVKKIKAESTDSNTKSAEDEITGAVFEKPDWFQSIT